MIDFERWEEIKALAQQALKIPSEERSAFLDSACPDPHVRQQVDALLSAPATADLLAHRRFLEPPPLEMEELAAGDRIAHFIVRNTIDKGGMGIVYRAYDEDNDRDVALKILSKELGETLQDRLSARFANEYIVALYESGTTEDGLTYISLEYVNGLPITIYCDRNAPTIAVRLELFRKVCAAVQVVHQKLIAHRDLKPGNILVTHGAKPKLLDFGTARLLASDTPGAPKDQPNDRFLTPEFASPEQYLNEEPSTATDVYSLGVLLCMLLAGRLPYRVLERDDIPLAILGMEPIPPSEIALRGKSSWGTEVTSSLLSCTAPDGDKKFRKPRTWPDLDAIVLKCLARAQSDRYQTAQLLADDIENYLSHRPVSARRGSTIESLRLRWRRNRLLFSVIGIIVIALAIFFAALRRERNEAIRQRDAARIQATRAEKVSRFLIDLFTLSDPARRPGSVVTARELLDKAAKDLPGTLKNQPEAVVPLLNTLGQVYNNLNLFAESERCYRSAMHIAETKLSHESLLYADCLFFIGQLESGLGHQDEAARLTKRSLDIRRQKLSPNDPNIVGSLHQIGTIAYYQRRFALAESYFREALRLLKTRAEPDLEALALVLNSLGVDLSEQQRYREAEACLRESLRTSITLYGYEHPLVATNLNNLAILLEEQGRLEESASLKRQALEIDKKTLGNEHANVAVLLSNLGFLLYRIGDLRQSAMFFDQAAQVARKALGPEDRSTIAIETNLAHSLRANGRIEEAGDLIRKVLDKARRKFGERDDSVGRALKVQGEVLCAKEDFSAAAKRFGQAIDVFDKENPKVTYGVIATRAEAGSCLVRQKRFAEAEPLLLEYLHAAKEGDKPDGTARLYALYTAWGRGDEAAAYKKIIEERFPLWARQLGVR